MVPEGISVGFGDDYHRVPRGPGRSTSAGLPAGRYDLVHRVNADEPPARGALRQQLVVPDAPQQLDAAPRRRADEAAPASLATARGSLLAGLGAGVLERVDQRLDVVEAAVAPAVDEERRRARDARLAPAARSSSTAAAVAGASMSAVKRSTSRPSSRGVADEVVVLERLLVREEQRRASPRTGPARPRPRRPRAARSACGCFATIGKWRKRRRTRPSSRCEHARAATAPRRGSTGTRSRRTAISSTAPVAADVVGHAVCILRSSRATSRSRSRCTAFIIGVVISPLVAQLHEPRALDVEQVAAQAQPRAGVGLDLGHAVAALARELVRALRVERPRALERRRVDPVRASNDSSPMWSSAASIVRKRTIACAPRVGLLLGKFMPPDERAAASGPGRAASRR